MNKQEYPWIDYMKLAAAVLVVIMHINPMENTTGFVHLLFCKTPGPLANAFFFIVAGYFFARGQGPSLGRGCLSWSKAGRTLKRLIALYLLWSVICLPMAIYSLLPDHFQLGQYLHEVIFFRSYFQLWFFVGVIQSLLVIYLLNRVFPLYVPLLLALGLTALDLLLETYYLVQLEVPHDLLALRYSMLPFLLGIYLQKRPPALSFAQCRRWMVLSFLGWFGELALLHFVFQVSLTVYYIMLFPAAVFLFLTLLHAPAVHPAWADPLWARKCSILVFGIHTWFLFLLDHWAKTGLLAVAPPVAFLLVCLSSLLFGWLVIRLSNRYPVLRKLY